MANARKLSSGNWRIRIYIGEDENGKKKVKSFTASTRWQAEKQADDYLKNGMKEMDKLTVGEAIDGYIKSKENVLEVSTLRGYDICRRTRLQSIMELDVTELNSFRMQLAINSDALRLSRKSISAVKSLTLTALRMYGIKPDINVTLPAKKPKLKQMPNPKTVYESIKGTDVELACLLAMWLSLRVSEVRGLQFGDICGNVLYVQRRKLCLGGKDVVRDGNKNVTSTRMLELPEYIAGMINEIPHDSPTDYIINDSYQNIARHFTQAVAAKGLKMTFHELRHLNASVMLKLGIPNKYAMERGGWSTDATLKQVYQHTFSDERKVVDSMIDDFFNDIVNEKN